MSAETGWMLLRRRGGQAGPFRTREECEPYIEPGDTIIPVKAHKSVFDKAPTLVWSASDTAEYHDPREYERQLEDAVLALWAEIPPERVYFLERQSPALIEFLRHLHHSIEHEQAMVRRNVWAES